jgi:hypothetical protein
MLKYLISLGLAITTLLGSLESVSYAQQLPIATKSEQSISQIKSQPSVPSFITEGFKTLCSGSGSVKDAYTLWANHSIPVFREMLTTQITDVIDSTFENFFGQCKGYSLIGSVSLTEKTQIFYIESEHDKMPLFWQFVAYQSAEGWIISSFTNNSAISEIVPPSVIEK